MFVLPKDVKKGSYENKGLIRIIFAKSSTNHLCDQIGLNPACAGLL